MRRAFAVAVAAALATSCAGSRTSSPPIPQRSTGARSTNATSSSEPTHSPSATSGPFPAAVSTELYQPKIDPTRFTTTIDNPYFPLVPGTTYRFEGTTSYGAETDTVAVTRSTVEILGVRCVVVRDAVKTNGELTELTFDWYTQDVDGNVWYFGEDSHEYSNGVPTSSYGSWKAGVNGAQPGVVMPGVLQAGLTYRQEYLAGQAEDMAKVLALDGQADVPYGSFDALVVTRDWSPLEPSVIEHKYYAEGIGVVKELLVTGGNEVAQLVNVTT
jgi:hypothetical protein